MLLKIFVNFSLFFLYWWTRCIGKLLLSNPQTAPQERNECSIKSNSNHQRRISQSHSQSESKWMTDADLWRKGSSSSIALWQGVVRMESNSINETASYWYQNDGLGHYRPMPMRDVAQFSHPVLLLVSYRIAPNCRLAQHFSGVSTQTLTKCTAWNCFERIGAWQSSQPKNDHSQNSFIYLRVHQCEANCENHNRWLGANSMAKYENIQILC